MSDLESFNSNNIDIINKMSQDKDILDISKKWFEKSIEYEYSYHFKWLGIPIIQYPQDIVATQEIIWDLKPDLIIETGIARGGSLIFYASLLEMIGEDGHIIGIDIDIREHNRKAIESHKLFKRITMIEGSSVDNNIYEQVYDLAKNKNKVLVLLDSNHTEEHVLKELEIYSKLVQKDSYIIVFDTIIEDLNDKLSANRPWKKGDNPKTAVNKFLLANDRFNIDKNIEKKILLTVCPSGYLKCIK